MPTETAKVLPREASGYARQLKSLIQVLEHKYHRYLNVEGDLYSIFFVSLEYKFTTLATLACLPLSNSN